MLTKNEHSKNTKNLNKLNAINLSNKNETINNIAISIQNFSKNFKKFSAVKDANIEVKAGTIHGFIGPNGSGKTTTIKCLVSAMVPSKGKMLIFGKESYTVEAKKHVGYIPESARFPQKISSENYLISMGQISGLSYKNAKIKTEEILKNLDLWKFKNRSPNNFSSGMKKKILLAQSLLNNPDVLILDEPAANLDPTARTELFNELKKLKNEGKTIFISSHILSELQNLADHVTILNYSKVVYTGAVNLTQDKYEIVTSDNQATKKLLESKGFSVEQSQKVLLVKIESEESKNKILSLIIAAKITISIFKPNVVDLQSMYEKIVIENRPDNRNPNKGGKK